MRKKAGKIIGRVLLTALMATTSAASAETLLEGARPFYLDPCPAARTPDPYPLPATMASGSDTRITCQEVGAAPKYFPKSPSTKRPAKRDVIEIHQK